MDKIEVLARLLQAEGRGLTMVFTQTKRAADQVAGALSTRGFAVATVHGDLGQGQRERALRAFRSGKVDVLVATDVAARGLDVEDVTHVVNYECPEDEKTYLHRIGRTGRAGRDGVAVTFVDWRDTQRWKLIDAALGLERPEPAETYSTSDHLFTELAIPRTATGTLPRAMRDRAGLEAEDIEDIGETGRPVAQRGRDRDRDRDKSRRRRGGAAAAGPETDGHEGNEGPDGAAPRERSRVRRRTRGGRDTRHAQPDTAGAGQAVAAATAAAAPLAPANEPHEAALAGPTGASAASGGTGAPERRGRTRRRRSRGSGQQAS